jgi:hypothetical protein
MIYITFLLYLEFDLFYITLRKIFLKKGESKSCH